ncbi:hypothetical protein [Saccharopolyspora kobensis]|uniref:hypothetical protein n=1 Tax=Saccharopolyspora kobensis TaxID=146035 RepID=UPI001160E3FF|nr:hypothetical protein [Saccharopolyspora kobensis]
MQLPALLLLEAFRQLLGSLPERERVRFAGQGRELGTQIEAHRARRGPSAALRARRRFAQRTAHRRFRTGPAGAGLLRVEARWPRRGRRILR